MKGLFIVVVCLGAMGCLCAQSKPSAPADIEQLFDGFFRDYIEWSPETGTKLGIPKALGIHVRNDKLDDVSDAAVSRLYKLYRKYRDWLSFYDRTQLSSSQQISYDILKRFLNDELEGEKYRYHTYIINPMFSFHNQLTTLMTEYHMLNNEQDCEDYISRLMQYNKRVTQLMEQNAIREKKGMLPPTYTAESFQQELDNFVTVPATENILYTSFVRRIADITMLTDTRKEELCKVVLRAIEDTVYPSYRRMSACVELVQMKTDSLAGVWKLPDGDAYYRYCLRYQTTTELTPEQVHTLGLAEVARIQNEIKEYFSILGIEGDDSFTELLTRYNQSVKDKSDERYYYPNTDDGKQQTLDAYQQYIDRMGERLPEMFSMLPRATVRVERVPHYKEKTAGTYYELPKLDGTAGGIFYANLAYQHFKPNMQTLAYHEAIPGHHLQIALAIESQNSRLFRSIPFFTGYIEGWALYAEKLTKEYGFFKDVHSKIGNLVSELHRAARLVVDTGIHYKRWTRQQAFEYMMKNVGWGSYPEIDRYIVWPGQACAYKIGELKILELRDAAKNALGEKYDIRDFHTAVLKNGAVPFDVLEQLVNEYIAVKKTE